MRRLILILSLLLAAPAAAETGSEPIAARGGKGKRKKKSKGSKLEFHPQTQAGVEAYNRGIEAYNAGEPAQAEQHFRQALELEPGCGGAMVMVGSSLVRQQRHDEAIAVLTKATELFAFRDEPWANLAEAHFAKGEFEQSLQVAERGLVQRPASVLLLEQLQWSAVRLGQYERVLQRLDARRRRGPNRDVDCLEVLVRVEMEDLPAARKAWKRCDGGDPRLVLNARSRLLGEVDDDELEAVRRLEAVGVDGAGTLADAIVAFNRQDYLIASAILDKLLAEHPGKVHARVLRARTRALLDQEDLALADLEAALEQEDWVQVSASGAISGVLTKRSEEDLLESLLQGSVLMVRLLAADGRLDEAKAQLAKAREAFGEREEFAAVESRIALAEGGESRWTKLADLLLAHPDDREVQLDAADLVFEHGAEAPDAILQPLREATEPTALFNVAAGLANANRFRRCLEFSLLHLDRAAQLEAAGVDSPQRQSAFQQEPQARAIAYRCALQDGQLSQARKLLTAVGPATIDKQTAGAHVHKLWSNKRPKEAWAVLVETKLMDRDPAWAVPMGITLSAELGLLDQALVLARGPHARATDRMFLATPLYDAGRLAEAQELLEQACPVIEAENKAACDNNLRLVRRAR